MIDLPALHDLGRFGVKDHASILAFLNILNTKRGLWRGTMKGKSAFAISGLFFLGLLLHFAGCSSSSSDSESVNFATTIRETTAYFK